MNVSPLFLILFKRLHLAMHYSVFSFCISRLWHKRALIRFTRSISSTKRWQIASCLSLTHKFIHPFCVHRIPYTTITKSKYFAGGVKCFKRIRDCGISKLDCVFINFLYTHNALGRRKWLSAQNGGKSDCVETARGAGKDLTFTF